MLIKNGTRYTGCDYVVNFVGEGGYLIGQRNGINTVCTIVDFYSGNVEIGHDDGHGYRDLISTMIEAGQKIHRPPYEDYVATLQREGPLPIPFYGVGILNSGKLCYRRLGRIIDAIPLQCAKRLRVAERVLPSPPRFFSPLVEWPLEHPSPRFSFSPKKAWSVEMALGRECIELERQAALAAIGQSRNGTVMARTRACRVDRLENLGRHAAKASR